MLSSFSKIKKPLTLTFHQQRFKHLILGADNLNVLQGDFALMQRFFNEKDVQTFSNLTGDMNRIHLDEEYAKNTQFGARIVHGLLVGSTFGTLAATYFPGCIYMKQEFKFLSPVFFNEEIESKIEVIEINREKKRITLKTTATKIKDNKNVISGEALIYLKNLKNEV